MEGGAFFSTLYSDYKDQGFEVVGINLDGISTIEGKKKLEDFKKLRGISFISLYDNPNLTVMKKYGVNAIPTTFLIDRKGYIRKIWIGYNFSWQDEFRKEIQKYLKEK